ncbi:hypothetical protein [Bacillus sp. FJAT-50079]|uniref:hypothetical protein n=1 Tax=Bacillus sp. FJAT-50079 TaxID=2833577 RepID=UPI001BC9CCD0|nr:hypothetical protein [Bacillus sp. FJAT-50079]MBS4208279.1 hypothetical protein [Bacillus sp. FJAT-50079]
MLIQNDSKLQTFSQTENSQPIKEGGTYSANIKEILPNNEALIQIKGEERVVKIEGNVPQSGKVTLQMMDMKQKPPVAKVVMNESPSASHSSSPSFPDGLKQAVKLLQDQKTPITRDMLHQLKTYFEKSPGTIEQKLETIAKMVAKKLDFTPAQIKAVHEALQGKPLGHVLHELVENELFTNQHERIKDVTIELIRQAEQASTQSSQSDLQSLISQAMKQVRTAPDIASVIQLIKESDWLSISRTTIDEAIRKAEQFLEAGKELAARQELAAALNGMAVEAPAEEQEAMYRIQSEALTALPIESRNFIVTTVTKKLSQAALDFKVVKRELANALQTTESVIKQMPLQARPSLEAAIKQLDHAILKSDFMLYTDMGTEKKLLQASSQLHEARKLLAKGEFSRASEIVHQVKTTVDRLIFQPSDVRVKHFVAKEMLQLDQPTLSKQIAHVLEEPLQLLRQEPTPRHALEYLRSLGMMHDSDLAHRLVAGGETNENLKNLLMKLAQTEANHSLGQKAEQALQHVTGQQLMSKADSSGLQTMLFSLPILLKDQVENVKVFMKSNSANQKMDWENCSLYFLLETKKMGDVGIMLTAVNRTLSLTFKNDTHGFKERIEPLVDKAKERLEEIGYQIGTMQFSALTTQAEPEKQSEKVKQPAFTERGYDFSV